MKHINLNVGEKMEYGIVKKLTFLLVEYAYIDQYKGNIGELEEDITKLISELAQRHYHELYRQFSEMKTVLQNVETEYGKPYAWIEDVEGFIEHLEYLPVEFGENQCERGIARSEAFGDYVYENGYDDFMIGGF